MQLIEVATSAIWKYEGAAVRHPWLTAAGAAAVIVCCFGLAVGWKYSIWFLFPLWAILAGVNRALSAEERISNTSDKEEGK